MNVLYFKRFYKLLVEPNLVKLTIRINLFTFIPGLAICVLIATLVGPQGYTIWNQYISDLGSLNVTPVPYLFDIIVMTGAILIIPAFLYNFKFLILNSPKIILDSNEKFLKRFFHLIIVFNAILGLFFLLVGSIGLFGIGIFSVDRTTQFNLHFIFSVLVFTGLIFGALFEGITITLKKAICPRFLGLYMIIGPFVAGLLFLNPPPIVTEPFLEWVMLFAQQIWLIPAAFYTLHQIKNI
ncbi:MAG: hypothetical protein EAX89_12095 [Candidatus Lokiarchaeota archaeon]|nr:hypothetical protein [Candidatus Lokiarchaeota archaeon]